MSESHEQNFREIVNAGDVPTRFLAGSQIELVDDFTFQQIPRHALFDFDGTLSLIREGWPEIMIPMMVDHLEATGTKESRESLRRTCTEFVMELTGKQTIYQMIRLDQEIQQRGGSPRDPMGYKDEYHARLMVHIKSRREDLRSGNVSPETLLVPGSKRILQLLKHQGVTLYLASGTDEQYVREEVDLLGLSPYFGERVFGARQEYREFSKAQVINHILKENQVEGASLVGFGDGYVEIQNIRDVGGTAVAVASDEARRSGQSDAWKRHRLIGAGANIVVPDFREADRLMVFLFEGREE